jgi:glycosyltransferase involved in cell wall biosynthesis
MIILYHHRTQGEEPESVHIANIVASLRRCGHEVDVVGPVAIGAPRQQSKPSSMARIKGAMPRVLVELAQLAYNVRSLWQLIGQLRRRRYDFIYERYALYNVAGLMAARMFGLALILEVNTPYAQAWGKYYGLRFPRLARVLERYTFRRADSIITVTDIQRALLEKEGVAAERITVCHNAIDPQEFDPQRGSESGLRRRLGLPPVVVGFVGTMNRWQGVQGFADVIQRVAAERGDVGFLFVGDGEGRGPLQAELERRGVQNAAMFVGRQSHAAIPEFVAAMDIGVLLDSNAYGSPMKVFEYWAMGKAVVAPSVPPVLEILRDGETGLLIAPGDTAAMACQIVRLAADPQLRARLGEAGRKHVLATHTWDQNAEKILQAYSPRRCETRRGEVVP